MGTWNIVQPEATTNLCTNPSFGLNTTGWAAAGTNTIERIGDISRRGGYCLKCTFADSTAYADYAVTLDSNLTYHLQCGVWVPANWDGGNIRITTSAFTTSITTINNLYTHGTSSATAWIYLESKLVLDSDDIGLVTVQSTETPTAGRFFYMDAFQIEQKDTYATVYCDGDQKGCIWLGTPHANTSERVEYEATGGRLLNFDSDLSMPIENVAGAGYFPVAVVSQNQALQRGDLYERTDILKRFMDLKLTVRGDDQEDYHSDRQTLIRLFDDSTALANSAPQPRLLQYTGAADIKEISVAYSGGLGGNPSSYAGEEVSIRVVANDPAFYDINDSTNLLDVEDAHAHRLVAAKIDGSWSSMGPPDAVGSTYTDVRALIVGDDETLYIGGDFLNWDNEADNDYVVSWDGTVYTKIGTDTTQCDDVVHCFAKDANGDIYAGGDFTAIGAATTPRGVALYDVSGDAWSELGPPSAGGSVYAIAIAPDGTVYVGGDFQNWDGTAASDYVAQWDGSSWTAVGTGTNGIVRALATDSAGNLYAGGEFTTAGGNAAVRVAKWNGSAWSAMDAGFAATVHDMQVAPDGLVYVVGEFTTAAAAVSTWNGTTWTKLGDGLTGGGADAFTLMLKDNLVYVGGSFTAAGGNTASNMAVWNGTTWTSGDFILGTAGADNIYALCQNRAGDIFVGTDVSGTSAHSGDTDVSYSGTAWAYPVIVIKRAGGTSARLLQVANPTTGATLYFDYAMADGEELTIDFRPGSRGLFSSFQGATGGGPSQPKGYQRGGDLTASVLPGSDFAKFYLVHNNGTSDRTNTITAFVDNDGATMTAFMYWRDTFSSYD